MRRSGQALGMGSRVATRRPGTNSVFCPACPEVGFNISKETLDAAREDERSAALQSGSLPC